MQTLGHSFFRFLFHMVMCFSDSMLSSDFRYILDQERDSWALLKKKSDIKIHISFSHSSFKGF